MIIDESECAVEEFFAITRSEFLVVAAEQNFVDLLLQFVGEDRGPDEREIPDNSCPEDGVSADEVEDEHSSPDQAGGEAGVGVGELVS